jgi:hypothetical protein
VETQALRQLKINHNLLSINVHYNRFAYVTHQREGGNLRPRRWGNPQTSGETLNHRGNPQPAGEGKPSTTGGDPQTTGEGKPSITGETLRQQEKFSAAAFVNHLSTWQLPNHMPRHIKSVLTCLGIKIPGFAKAKK